MAVIRAADATEAALAARRCHRNAGAAERSTLIWQSSALRPSAERALSQLFGDRFLAFGLLRWRDFGIAIGLRASG
jgi:hypothetical protein